MKKSTLCLFLVGLCAMLTAQPITTDASFGQNGFLETNLRDRNLNPYGYTTVVLADGSLITLGDIYWDSLLAVKYQPDGTLVEGFTTPLVNISQYQAGAALLSDGKIIASGHQSVPPYHSVVTRLHPDGGVDTTFGNGGIASVLTDFIYISQLFELSNKKILVFGCEKVTNGNPPIIVVRLNPDGAIDPSFGVNGYFRLDVSTDYEFIPGGLEQPDGKLLFAGMSHWKPMLIRLNSDGSRDSTFHNDGLLIDPMPGGGQAFSVKLQSDGKIVVGGYSGSDEKPMVARYHPDGTRDNSFADEGVQYFSEMALYQEGVSLEIMPDGKIILAITDFTGGNMKLARLLPDGQRDTSFGINGIYEYPGAELRPRCIQLNEQKLLVTGLNMDTELIFLLRFLLDLNVGTLNPNSPVEPTLWIYPNPVAEQFNLQFSLTQNAPISIQLLDMQGKRIQTLLQNQPFESGEHTLNLRADFETLNTPETRLDSPLLGSLLRAGLAMCHSSYTPVYLQAKNTKTTSFSTLYKHEKDNALFHTRCFGPLPGSSIRKN